MQALIKNTNCFVVIETDHNSEVADSVVKAGMEVEGKEDEEEEEDQMPEALYGKDVLLPLYFFCEDLSELFSFHQRGLCILLFYSIVRIFLRRIIFQLHSWTR